MSKHRSDLKYRVALVGCGSIARTGHVPALLAHPRFALAALCDVDPARAAALAALAPGARTVTDYGQLVGAPDVDAFILALHPEHSVDIALDLLGHGYPVLDEKPMARTIEDGRRLVDGIHRTAGLYQLGFVFRFSRLIRDLVRPIRSLGTPCLYDIDIYDERLDRSDTAHLQLMQQILARSSVPTHEGSHVVDYLRLWNESHIEQVEATATRTEADLAGPNVWSCHFILADNSIVRLGLGWLLPQLPPSAIRAAGPQGWIQVDLRLGRGTWCHDGGEEPFISQPLAQDWIAQLDAFAAAIDTGRPHGPTADDGLRVLTVTQGCEESAGLSRIRA